MSAESMRRARHQAVSRGHQTNRVTVVVGPPASGKTTYVSEHAADGDTIVDFDALAVAFGSSDPHLHSNAHQAVAHAARDAAVGRALRTPGCRVWLILTHRSQIPQFGLSSFDLHEMDTPLDECERRAMNAGRSQQVLDLIRNWRN